MARFGIIFQKPLGYNLKMYVHSNSSLTDWCWFLNVYFEDLFFYTLVVQLPLNSRLIDLIDLIVTISIIETEYLLNPGPASPYIVLTVTDHTNLMLSVFHPPTYILQFFDWNTHWSIVLMPIFNQSRKTQFKTHARTTQTAFQHF